VTADRWAWQASVPGCREARRASEEGAGLGGVAGRINLACAAGFRGSRGRLKPTLLDKKCTCVHITPVPTILRIHGFRIGFFQADLAEPPHVHVRKQGGDAKVWLDPVEVAGSRGFRPHELNEVVRIIVEFRGRLMAAWAAEEKKHGDGSGEDSHR